jgi:glycosyltransferase involved in cell wall biosynthesis
MPLYNKAPYVKKALESVLSQTYTDYEIIVVDDGSTDNSADIVRELVISNCKLVNDQFRLISQANAGVAAARNNGVAKSKGEYVCFLDADDWWKPTFLEEMDNLIAEYPDAGIYASNYIYYKPGKTHIALNLERGYIDYPEAYLQSGSMPVTSITTCMPRKVFDEMGGFPVGIKLGEDFLLWAKTALHYKVAFCERALAYYNNDVPVHLRATRNLHAPQYHKIFNLGEIEREVRGKSEEVRGGWKALLDKHRVVELYDYWLSDEYHEAAAAELKKVDWSKQPKKMKAQYEKPIWMLKAKRRFLQIGSFCKQKLIRLITK